MGAKRVVKIAELDDYHIYTDDLNDIYVKVVGVSDLNMSYMSKAVVMTDNGRMKKIQSGIPRIIKRLYGLYEKEKATVEELKHKL